MIKEDESQWMQLAVAGNPLGVALLYERYMDRIYRYALAKLGHAEEAQDITEQVFLKMIESLADLQLSSIGLGPWLYRVAHNLIIDHVRQKARRRYVPIESLRDQLVAQEGDPYLQAEAADFSRHIGQAMRRLTGLQAQVIVLKFAVGLTNAEAGRVLGRSENAVKALQLNALRNLHRHLREMEPEIRTTRSPVALVGAPTPEAGSTACAV